MAPTQPPTAVLAQNSERAAFISAGRRLRRRLRGRRLEAFAALPTDLELRLEGQRAFVLRAELDPGGGAVLRVGGDGNGDATAVDGSLYPELSGRKIVRVTGGGDHLKLHFGDGSTLELRAVINLDGCRIATVHSRRQQSRASSLLDHALGRLLQPHLLSSQEPKPCAGAGEW